MTRKKLDQRDVSPEENKGAIEMGSSNAAKTSEFLGSLKLWKGECQRKWWRKLTPWRDYEGRGLDPEERLGHDGEESPGKDGWKNIIQGRRLWRRKGTTMLSPMTGCGSSGRWQWRDAQRDNRLVFGRRFPSSPWTEGEKAEERYMRGDAPPWPWWLGLYCHGRVFLYWCCF